VYARGFRSVYKPRRQGALSFAELLARVADVDPEVRVRFTSPHPKDFSDEVGRLGGAAPGPGGGWGGWLLGWWARRGWWAGKG
jgi:hypothetical protein